MAVLAIAVVGCSNLENVLPRSGGVWAATSQTVNTYVGGSLVDTEVTSADSLPTYNFRDDNTGETTYQVGDPEPFTWTTNSDNDQVIITDQALNLALTFDVIENNGKTQKWSTIIGDANSDYFEFLLDLERQ
ncbi:MAG: hypothetical protein AAFN68_11505 [Pseudomonadota bacterium]